MWFYRATKRIIDFSVSSLCMVIFSPFLLLLGLSIFFSDGWPIIFSSKRMGKDGRQFTVYKFRTLINGLKRRNDGLSDKVVINKFARFMRDTHLDEILQLFNVVKGDMSLIGPRPLDIPRYYHLKSKDPAWEQVLSVKPGMTCINQIARYTPWGMEKARQMNGLGSMKRRNRLRLDKYYMRRESLVLDMKIVSWTLWYLFSGFFQKMFKKGESYR